MRTEVIIIAIILLSAISIKAQDFDFEDKLSKGMEALDSGQYELAIKYLGSCEKFASQDTTKEMQEVDYLLLNYMADSYANLEKYKIAIDLCTRALNIQKLLFGESHPDYATLLSNLAGYYEDLGDYSKAVEYGTQAMGICKEVFGKYHRNLARVRLSLYKYRFPYHRW